MEEGSIIIGIWALLNHDLSRDYVEGHVYKRRNIDSVNRFHDPYVFVLI